MEAVSQRLKKSFRKETEKTHRIFFKKIKPDGIIEDIVSGWEEKGYAQERLGECFNYDKIYKMVAYYETALNNWKAIREEIASFLPREKQK